jgi:L-ribulose-5-phosphate 3-epimerase
MSEITRRDAMVLSAAGLGASLLSAQPSPAAQKSGDSLTPRRALTIFSQHLNWAADIEAAIEVAAQAGFGGIAWTVRSNDFIHPATVARDLPRAVELTRRAGLRTPSIVTSLNDAGSPFAQQILETAAGLGIHLYRMQTHAYDYGRDVPAQLEALRPAIAGLVALNERYRCTALVHTHGGLVAGAVWDTWLLLKDFDPERVAINFDTGYGTMKLGNGWMEAARFAHRYIRCLALKDFIWRSQPQGPKRWMGEICQPGAGMVDFPGMFSYFQSIGFNGPTEVQFEYPVSVAGRAAPVSFMSRRVGEWQLEMPKADFITLLKRDVDFYEAQVRATGLTTA